MNGLSKVLTMSCMLLTGVFNTFTDEVKEAPAVEILVEAETEVQTEVETEQVLSCVVETEMETETEEPEMIFTEEEIELIALVTMAEAEGESEYGKRLVIDTIINRVNSEDFPNTVSGVIYQPCHFESIWNGRVDQCYVDADICELVRGEMRDISDPYVMYFCAGDYGQYGEPMYQVGNHYFSSY